MFCALRSWAVVDNNMKNKVIKFFVLVGLVISTPLFAGDIPQSGWSLLYVDSEELVGENGAAVNSFDGNPLTIWHTEWKVQQPLPPHEIQLDLGAVYALSGLRSSAEYG